MNNKFDDLTKGLAQAGARRQTLKEPGVGAPRPSLHLPSLAAPKRGSGKLIFAGCGSASLCLALAGFLKVSAGAQTYDAVADFSTNSNPSSVWSYRFRTGTIRDGNYPLLPYYGDADGSWIPSNPGAWSLGGAGVRVPLVGVNQTGSDVIYSSPAFTWPNGTMHVHPGNLDLVVVSWLSSSTALLNINFSFTSINPACGNGIAWFVEKNDSSNTLSSGSYSDGGGSGPLTLSGIPVAPGDRINFIVDPNGDYSCDSTVLSAQIVAYIGPALLADSFTLVTETCTNNAIDPGERVTISLGLRNIGTANTTNLVATLLSGGGVSSPSGPQIYGVLLTNGPPAARSFSFTGSGNCGELKTAILQLQDGATNLGLASFTFLLGQNSTSTNSEGFDAVTPPALPAAWDTSASGAESPWVTTAASSDSAPNSAFVPDVSYIGWSELDSPLFTLPTGAAQLGFRHYYDLEWSYDGGVLEININGGGWNDILAAGGSFAGGGYVMPISTFYGNPLAGRSAWTGNSGGFITTLVNLPAAAAGQSVQFRWVCGSDNSLTFTGWYVDTIAITTTTPVCCTPPPVFTGVTRNGTALTLNWSAVPGRTYQVLYSTSLTPANWTALMNIVASDFTATVADSITVGRQRFYRVMLLP